MIDSIIETILVLHGDRKQIQQDELDDYYWPSSGKWAMRGKFRRHILSAVLLTHAADLNKVFVDDNTYTYGHGKAYKFYGINPAEGAVVVVRPDQCTCQTDMKNRTTTDNLQTFLLLHRLTITRLLGHSLLVSQQSGTTPPKTVIETQLPFWDKRGNTGPIVAQPFRSPKLEV